VIRFCDKEVYNVTEGEMTRAQILQFFLQSEIKRNVVLAVYMQNGTYKGIITYYDLIESENLNECINTNTIRISDNFWEEAESFFNNSVETFLTVIDNNDKIIGFAYDDDDIGYHITMKALTALDNEFILPERYSRVQMVVITDLNELSWKCYKVFINAGYEVCVIGEKWEWFGFISGYGYLNYPDYAKLYIYSEGTEPLRKEKEYGKLHFPNVNSSFAFIQTIAFENSHKIYQRVMEQFRENGVEICECCIPMVQDLDFKTEDELLSIKYGLSINQYVCGDFEHIKRECLEHIYGKENIVSLNEGIQRDIEMIPLGEITGIAKRGSQKNKRIYLIGPCIVAGYGCIEEEMLYRYLQKYVDKFGYQVIAVSFNNLRFDILKSIGMLPVREQDIILSINNANWFSESQNKYNFVDLKPIYDDRKRDSMFCCHPIHTNSEGNRRIAKEIMKRYLLDIMNKFSGRESNKYIQKGELLNQRDCIKIDDYIRSIKKDNCMNAGAIVMNGNPFTNGHRYLIANAAKMVEQLYVFVVEEDKSFFKFEDRFQMIKNGTYDLSNVIVVPSGEWVLSYKTFPVYFEKEEMQQMKINACYDLEIFARYIAPKLGIEKRFVGEEPFDAVTRQYNEQMKEILSFFNIGTEIIPRMVIRGEIISASKVRKCMKEGKWGELKEFVPDSTFKICERYKSLFI